MGTSSSATPIGSVNDVKLANGGQYQGFLDQLSGAMSKFSDSLGGAGSNAANAFGRVQDTASNYENYLKRMMGQGGLYDMLLNSTGQADPTSAMNQFMSMQPGLSRAAQDDAATALSDVYSTGRTQAAAAGDAARRQAAGDLAAAGLLQSGGAVGAMTEATAKPMMDMESALAQTRAQYLGGLQNALYGGAMGSLTSGYGTNMGLLGQTAGLGLQGNEDLTKALGMAGSGYGDLASLYGGLYGQGLGYGASMSMPEYWQPQYINDEKGFDWTKAGSSALSAGLAGASVPGMPWLGIPAALLGGVAGGFA